jgi:hypothetical protein
MSEANSRPPDESAFDEQLVNALRPADADDVPVDPESLPPLTEAERAAVASVRIDEVVQRTEEGITGQPRPAPVSLPRTDEAEAIQCRPTARSGSRGPARPRVDLRRRWLLVAASVLVAVGLAGGVPGGIYWYSSHEISRIDAALSATPQRERQRMAEAEHAVRARNLELLVTGPATLQPSAPNVYHIESRNLNREAVSATISARVVDQKGNLLYEEKERPSEGDYRLELPRSLPLKPSTQLTLEIVARGQGEGLAEVREKLALDDPVYATHLVTDKPMYRPGEVVSFRSLTLDRFSLKPPRDDLRLVFTLKHPDGKEEVLLAGCDRFVDQHGRTLQGPDGKPIRGVGAGEYPIDPQAPGGEYTLTVKEGQNRFPPHKRSFIVNHYQPPRLNKKLEFGRKSYGPGGEVTALCIVTRAEGGAAVANQPLTATVQVDGKHYDAEGHQVADAALRLKTDGNGVGQFRFKLPAQIERGEASLSVQCTDGGSIETIVRPIPIVLKKLQVEFYPEGGDLVAGVPNRVYFQARTLLGKPADVQGRVVDPDGKVLAADVHTLTDAQQPGVNQGTGVFTITPEAGRKYELKIDNPAGIEGRFPLPEARPEGVVLSTPRGVIHAEEPVIVHLSSMGSPRRLVVALFCRGRPIDQAPVQMRANETIAVRLNPEAALGGVFRVTVFEDQGAGIYLVPRAERLVYRVPLQRLNLAVKPDKSRYVPGDRVHLALEATNEEGEPAAAIALVAVSDLSVHTLADEKTARSMPTQFYLATEIRRPEDLEQADFLLSNHPQAFAALDLLLGTQGWRRFAEQDPEKLRREHGDDAERLLAAIGQTPIKTTNLREVEPAYREQLLQEQGFVRGEMVRDRLHLQNERVSAVERMQAIRFLGQVVLVLGAVAVVMGLVVAVVLLGYKAAQSAAPDGWKAGFVVAFGMLFLVCSGITVFNIGQRAETTFQKVGAKIPAGGGAAAPMNAAMREREDAPRDFRTPVAPPLPRRPDAGGGDGFPAPGVKGQVEQPVANPANAPMPGMPGAPPPNNIMAIDGIKVRQMQGNRPVKEGSPGGIVPLNRRFRDALQSWRQRVSVPPKAPQGSDVRSFLQAGELVDPGPPLVLREYAHQHEGEPANLRTDFSETLYWNPVLVLPNGKNEVSFDLCDSLTTFQISVSAHTPDGRLGSATATLESRRPFSVEPKLPVEVTAGDVTDVPVTIANDTDAERSVSLTVVIHGLAFADQEQAHQQLRLGPNQRTRQVIRLSPAIAEGWASVRLEAKSAPFAVDAVERSFRVVPSGFPVTGSKSDLLEGSVKHDIPLPETWFKGSLRCQVQVYPSILADLQGGLEGMLREPYGCFEQTSSSNYPNLLVLDYLRTRGLARADVESRARELLDRGYHRLITFECNSRTAPGGKEGYEWFGGNAPPHEGLTAFGLLEFRDMSRVFDVDAVMVERTRHFLLSRRDGQGGFVARRGRTFHGWGEAPPHIQDAYILWALTESQEPEDLSRELNAVHEKAKDSTDPYFVALVANCLLNRGQKEAADPLLKKLAGCQKPDGPVDGATRSIVLASGRDLEIETTALSVLAWLKAHRQRPTEYRDNLRLALQWLGQQRGSWGGFGSTQATVLTLRALVAFSEAQRAAEAGSLVLSVGDGEVARRHFAAGIDRVLTLDVPEVERQLRPGKNTVRLDLTGKNQFPYTLSWSYHTLKPPNSEDCRVLLRTRLDRARANEGETVRLTATVENKSAEAEGMTVAILGLPAGLTLPEDLKQLKDYTLPREGGKEPGLIDHWEIRGRELVLYWRGLGPKQKIEVNLDLICRVPGEYAGPASRAYLYYNADNKCWTDPLRVVIGLGR